MRDCTAKTSTALAESMRSVNTPRNGAAQRWHRQCMEWLPLASLPPLAWFGSAGMVPWARMWLLTGAIMAGCKWLTWRRALAVTETMPCWRSLGYLLAWPGMDAEAFFDIPIRPSAPSRAAWAQAVVKTLFGAVLVWGAVGQVFPWSSWAAGWIGLAGLTFLLHFGVFHVLALVWQRAGVGAEPIMRWPIAARSVGDFWGRRWNLAFRRLAHEFIYLPLASRLGVTGAMTVSFLVSGLLHELVISLPADGGYGLPTAYFLLQAAGLRAEHSPLGRRFGLGRGDLGRVFALGVVGLPAVALFHPPFVEQVAIPFLHALGAC
jgi:hypothetical protein